MNYLEAASQYENTLSEEVKKEQGIVYTPLFIVNYILGRTLTPERLHHKITVIDPACGTGMFLIEALKRLHDATKKSLKSLVEENIFGIDYDPEAVKITKQLLRGYVLASGEEEPQKFNIYTGNSTDKKFLEKEVNRKFDVVVGNPPYVRIQNIADADRKYLKDWRFANGDSDLYVVFIELGLSLLAEDGVLGYITANSYLKNKSTEELMNYIVQEKKIDTLVDFEGAQIFGKKALTYTSILIVRNKPTEEVWVYKPLRSLYERLDKEEDVIDLDKELQHDRKSWENISPKNLLIHSTQNRFINRMENAGKTLKDLVRIRVGLATLADSIFFLDDPKDLEPDALKPCVKVSKLKTESDIGKYTKSIIYPYQIVEGKAVPYKEEEMRKKFPKTVAYLEQPQNKAILNNRDKGKKGQDKTWWLYGRTQGLTSLFGRKLLMPPMVQRPYFVLCEDKDLLYLSGYAIFSDDLDLEMIKLILESDLFHKYVQLTGKDFHGGWKACTKHSIERFSIPKIRPEEMDELRKDVNKFLTEKYNL